MKKTIQYQILLFIFILACSSEPGIIREITISPVKSQLSQNDRPYYSDKFCSVHIMPLQLNDLKKLLNYSIFINKERRVGRYRIPNLLFFRIAIKNKTIRPLKVGDITIQYGNNRKDKLSADAIKKKYKSPLYDIFNFNSIFAWRRLVGANKNLKEPDYNNETIESKIKFIPGGDTVISIIAFDWIPIQHNNYKLRLELNTMERKKSIDFKLTKSEYRSKGKYFQKSNMKMK